MSEGSNEDQSQKTEEPTRKRLEDARKKGQIPFSREVNNFFLLFVFAVLLISFSPYLMGQVKDKLKLFIIRAEDFSMDNGATHRLIYDVLVELTLIMMIPLSMTVCAALLSGVLQTKFNVSMDRIKPKLEKISLLKGVKRMFSLRNFVEFLKGILKITIVGTIAFFAVEPYSEMMRMLPFYTMDNMLNFLLDMTRRILIGAVIIVFVIAILDYAYQNFEYIKNLRMSKQDIKDEYKQQEGDPQIKAKLRQIRMERAKGRMMAAVPEADVVITNPTHYAIALKYDSAAMQAPIVIAKGKDKVALRIREIAEEHRIPKFRNPIVARALFDSAELDQEIPTEHFGAVAKIIGYVYKMQGKMPKK